jgi:hypothetical protein
LRVGSRGSRDVETRIPAAWGLNLEVETGLGGWSWVETGLSVLCSFCRAAVCGGVLRSSSHGDTYSSEKFNAAEWKRLRLNAGLWRDWQEAAPCPYKCPPRPPSQAPSRCRATVAPPPPQHRARTRAPMPLRWPSSWMPCCCIRARPLVPLASSTDRRALSCARA